MKLRVNLLRPEEQRYQGPVSLRFAAVIGGITLGAIALLVAAIGLFSIFSVQSELKTARESWTRMEPRHTQVADLQKKDNDNRALLAELDRWTKLRSPWSGLLGEIRQIAPPTLQFTRLAVRSDWTFVKPAAPAIPEGKEAPKEVVLPNIPTHRTYVSLEGRATGELADEVVVAFVRTLQQSPGFKPLFESVKLQRLVREAAMGTDRQPDRLFQIEGEFFTRKLE